MCIAQKVFVHSSSFQKINFLKESKYPLLESNRIQTKHDSEINRGMIKRVRYKFQNREKHVKTIPFSQFCGNNHEILILPNPFQLSSPSPHLHESYHSLLIMLLPDRCLFEDF